MPVEKLKNFLDQNNVRYVQISHSPAPTALELAESIHIRGNELAKSVVVKLDGDMTLLVLPASYKVGFSLLEKATGATNVELASERECEQLFPGSDAGAMSPFGNLYDVDVIVDSAVTESQHIAFNGGTDTEVIRMSFADFSELVKPTVASFSVVRG